jgi:hypothetical protein
MQSVVKQHSKRTLFADAADTYICKKSPLSKRYKKSLHSPQDIDTKSTRHSLTRYLLDRRGRDPRAPTSRNATGPGRMLPGQLMHGTLRRDKRLPGCLRTSHRQRRSWHVCRSGSLQFLEHGLPCILGKLFCLYSCPAKLSEHGYGCVRLSGHFRAGLGFQGYLLVGGRRWKLCQQCCKSCCGVAKANADSSSFFGHRCGCQRPVASLLDLHGLETPHPQRRDLVQARVADSPESYLSHLRLWHHLRRHLCQLGRSHHRRPHRLRHLRRLL